MDSIPKRYVSTDREGRHYADRLIASTTTEFREEMGEAISDDVPAFVVRTLTNPYHDAIAAEHSARPYRTVIDGVTVTFGDAALAAFTDTLWRFVSLNADRVDEATLAAFRGDL